MTPSDTTLSTMTPYTTIMFGNVAGLLTRNDKTKLKILNEEATTENAILIALTESHLKEYNFDSEIQLGGYTSFRTDRASNRKKGGVITYVLNTFSACVEILASGSNTYVEYHMLYIKQIDLIVITLYRPPECPSNMFISPLEEIKIKLEGVSTCLPNIVLTGDFNFPTIDWNSENVIGGGAAYRLQAEALMEFARDLCLQQFIDLPTRGDNILDLFFTNNGDIVQEYEVIPWKASDHRQVKIKTSIMIQQTAETSADRHITGFSKLNLFSHLTNWPAIKYELSQVAWPSLDGDHQPAVLYEDILRVCLDICTRHSPTRRSANNMNDIPRDRRILMRKRAAIRRKLKMSKSEHNKRLIEARLERMDQKLKDSVLKQQHLAEMTAVDAIRSNPKYFYTFVKNKSKLKADVMALTDTDGNLENDPPKLCEIFSQQFARVFSAPITTKVIHDSDSFFIGVAVEQRELCELQFAEADIVAAIRTIRTTAAPGPDEFPAILLKNCESELAKPLQLLYSRSFRTGIIPEALKKGKITPIYKKGLRAEPSNYRPVSLTSHIIKVMEKIIVKNMTSYLERNRLMNPGQHGFRAGHSCLSQLIEHQENIVESLERGSNVDVVYLDFEKAFDKVDHGVLLHKIRDLGITGTLGKWIHSFLTNRTQFVAVKGATSQATEVVSGVPQGSVLGPLLFLVHIADISNSVVHSTVRSFADDTRIQCEITNVNSTVQLQNDLDVIYDWAEENNMSFNDTKFELIRYGKNCDIKNQTSYKTPKRTDIEEKNMIKDLGIVMTDDAVFGTHIGQLVKKCRMQMGWILRVFSSRDELSMLTLYRSLLLPLLEYCCQLWHPWKRSEAKTLEGVQRTFTNKISSVRDCGYWDRLRKLHLYSLERRRERYIIIYTWKIINKHVPNVSGTGITTRNHPRLGVTCVPPKVNIRAGRVTTIRHHSLPVVGPRLYNSLPGYLRNINSVNSEIFKNRLDNFLKHVPDEPNLDHYRTAAESNSIDDQLRYLHINGITIPVEEASPCPGSPWLPINL